MSEQVHKPHRAKKEKKTPTSGTNPKAFAYAAPGRVQKQAARSSDVKEKRLHVPLVDRLPEEAPPIVVGIVGPPGVGKTTLIKSLIRRYTKQTLSRPVGPLTVVTSKRRRLTFIECPSDSFASMIDLAKIVDIVLLMIDGNFGFEMETMEFLNVLSAQGMPGNVFGILTHLDLFKKQDALRAQKKRLKHRFWSELYQGAKLFYLSGVVNGRYPDREILNLSRFLSVMKNPRPLVWRNSHPYCVADRFLDLTPPTSIESNPKCDRTVALYGYLRGTNFPAQGARVHVPGVGDLGVSTIERLPDPCPTPYQQSAKEKIEGRKVKRRLGEKQKVLFAPMSDVGGVLVDQDAVYIDVKTNTFDREAEGERGFGEQLMVGLQNERRLLGRGENRVRLFHDADEMEAKEDEEELGNMGRKMRRQPKIIGDIEDDSQEDEGFASGDNDDGDGEDELAELNSDEEDEETLLDGGRSYSEGTQSRAQRRNVGDKKVDGDVAFADSDSDLGSLSTNDEQRINEENISGAEDGDESDSPTEIDPSLRWKVNLAKNAGRLHRNKRSYRTTELARLMYDDSKTPAEVIRIWSGAPDDESSSSIEGDAEDDNFFSKAMRNDTEKMEDRMIPDFDYERLKQKWSNEENIETLRRRFTSANLLQDKSDGEDDADNLFQATEGEDEGDGAFEDLETGEVHGQMDVVARNEDQGQNLEAERERNARRKEELKLRFEEEDREGLASDKANARQDDGVHDQEFGEDDWYDAQKAQIQKQLDINRAEFDQMDELSRVRVEGHTAGTYARLVLENVPYEFCANFNPRFPLLVGGLTATEDRFGFVQVRIKRHRWHKKILKTNDPLIFSLGWRRFQTTPLYSISDSRTRNRMLKYTPEHMHCFGTFYGPLIAPNTGFCCVQSLSNKNPGFRVAATGVVLNVDESTEIVKKLKLTGHPYKIFKNTAFIKDMFGSSLEIAKFEGAGIRTVSGVRGQIKRALSKPEGHFRATFEDKILMSDIVFLRAWYPVRPHRFYNPVTNLLDAQYDAENGHSQEWQGMRLAGEVRAAEGIATPKDRNSAYRPIERPNRHFNPLRIPRKLQADLPFKSQPANMLPQRQKTYLQKRAVVADREERKARNLLQQVMTLRNEKVAKRRAKQEERKEPYRKKIAQSEELRRAREKREQDEYWRREGKKRKNQDSEGGGGKKKR
ncbi:MAG: Glycoside hydrolase 2 (Mannanase, beta-galactosidase) [Bathelium mastoideum]|nr:MAG: Glycoside hydrolase 2 (Mannanase, beta-galactosidase) [Bathelium mastoideum]